jgi:exopolysaccharide biosynthesis protein
MYKISIALFIILFFSFDKNVLYAQQKWENVDSAFQPLPDNFHVYKCVDSLDGKPFIAYYAEAKLKDKHLIFTTDTTYKRRLTTQQFFEKNNNPLLVVNGTFFSFVTNQNLNVVIKEGKLVSYNVHTISGKGKDTLTYKHPLAAAIGIDKKRNADVAWLLTDSTKKTAYANQIPTSKPFKDSVSDPSFQYFIRNAIYFGGSSFIGQEHKKSEFKKWKMKTAIGGGPVLVQNGEIKITNNEEMKFAGKASDDKHPRTCMGYTKDGRLIIMVIQGRFPGIADGVTLMQEAQLLVNLGCTEALNLDGGGSSCMLINGKETIKPSDTAGQRAVPAVFIIK